MCSQIKFRVNVKRDIFIGGGTPLSPRILVHPGTVLVMMIFSYLTSPVSSLLTAACALELANKGSQRFHKNHVSIVFYSRQCKSASRFFQP